MPDDVAAQLDALFAAPAVAVVRGEPVRVRGITLEELPACLRLYSQRPAAMGGADAGELDAETGERVGEGVGEVAGQHPPAEPLGPEAWGEQFAALLATLCGRPAAWLVTLDDDEFDRLCSAMWHANRVLFDDGAAGRRGPRGAGRRVSWATAVAQLVEAGHRLADVRGYTLAQVEQLAAAHARLAADRRLDDIAIARAAQADQKSYRRIVAQLEQGRARLGE